VLEDGRLLAEVLTVAGGIAVGVACDGDVGHCLGSDEVEEAVEISAYGVVFFIDFTPAG
jgi:hypothetical protein